MGEKQNCLSHIVLRQFYLPSNCYSELLEKGHYVGICLISY